LGQTERKAITFNLIYYEKVDNLKKIQKQLYIQQECYTEEKKKNIQK